MAWNAPEYKGIGYSWVQNPGATQSEDKINFKYKSLVWPIGTDH